MMMKKRGWVFSFCLLEAGVRSAPQNHGCDLFLTGGYENERDAPSDAPSPIINIKKEKRETEEETKEILRNLERDNVSHNPLMLIRLIRIWTNAMRFLQFIDDPFLRSEQKSCPVQLPLALSGWGFKEEFSPNAVKKEKVEDDDEPMETAVEGEYNYSICFIGIVVLMYDNKALITDFLATFLVVLLGW